MQKEEFEVVKKTIEFSQVYNSESSLLPLATFLPSHSRREGFCQKGLITYPIIARVSRTDTCFQGLSSVFTIHE